MKTPLPYVRDSFLLENVLSPTECDRLIASAELAGYRPDEPLGGQQGGSILVDHGIYNATGIVRDERRSLRQVSDEPDEDIMPLLPPQHTIPFPGCRCPLFNLYQQKEAELLKTMFKNYVKFPTLQRGSDGNVIVDFHPEYIDFSAKAAERHMSSTSPVLTAIFGHYASILQNGDQVWLADGLGTCYTMKLLRKAMNSVIPGATLRLVGYSDDILPIQAKFENKKGQNTCTERDFKEIYKSKDLLYLRTAKISWLMIDAINNGYVEFRAMIYGVNPKRYWIDILTMAHGWAIDYFNSRGLSVIFTLTLIKSPHFCAVNRGCALGQRLSMDSAVTKFLGVEKKCTYFQDTDFTKLHFGSGEFNPMLEFFREWTPEDRVITKLSSITLSKFLTAYLSNWNGEIIKYLNSIGNKIISPNDITIQQLASYYGHTGGKGNLGKKKTEEHRANISAGNLGKKKTEEHRANIHGRPIQVDKWIDNLARVKMFIDTEGRLPRLGAGDADEKKHARWIKSNKHREKGTNREQLMRRDIPLAFIRTFR